MKPDEKNFLINEVMARIPYGVHFAVKPASPDYDLPFSGDFKVDTVYIRDDGEYVFAFQNSSYYTSHGIENIKPYLRPISSMMQGEWEQMSGIIYQYGRVNIEKDELVLWLDGKIGNDIPMALMEKVFVWLKSHHFDYGKPSLIEMDMALEAPEGMYNC